MSSADTKPRLIKPGTRTTVAGRTGSGKTSLARFLMQTQSLQKWVVFNPKHTEGYEKLADYSVMRKWDAAKFDKLIAKDDVRFIDIKFAKNELTPEFMDAVVNHIHESYDDIGFCFDELYYMHKNMEPGEGMTGVYTRGRERKQSVLGLVQRPKRISLFCFSEADYIVAMALNLEMDRKRMVEATGDESFIHALPKYVWRWYNVDEDTVNLWGPVPLTN
jgi:energy-coupling factor transporter ATP-binding protein EcfA2